MLVGDFKIKCEVELLEIVVFGIIFSGKFIVFNFFVGWDVFYVDVRGGMMVERNEVDWLGNDLVWFVDIFGFGEVDGVEYVMVSVFVVCDVDFVLFVVDGFLCEYELCLLDVFVYMEKWVVVCFNKMDWYESEDFGKLKG